MDVLLLHFLGDLPKESQRRVMETLFIGLMNLGPREVENRSAMIAGISKTRPEHLLAIGLLAGENDANEVKLACEFIRYNCSESPEGTLDRCLQKSENAASLAPGFGSRYGFIDPILTNLAEDISSLIPECSTFNWCMGFARKLRGHEQGWLSSGLAAAVCVSLGLNAQTAVGIYQLAKSVGVVAYAMEQARLPMTKAPFLSDEFYEQTQQS